MGASEPVASGSSFRKILLRVLPALLLWPVIITYPYPPEIYLDASWQQTLIYAHQQGWQFGHDINFTWGPWGFLCSLFHLGDTAASTRLLWELGGKMLLAAGLAAATRHLSPARQAVFIIIVALFAPVFQDTVYLIFITLAVLTGLMRRSAGHAEQLAFIAGLAFLAQIKFTYTLLIAAGVALACGVQLGHGRWRHATLIAACFPLMFMAWWLAAGQKLTGISSYLLQSWAISTGYPDAMSIKGAWSVLLCGLAVLLWQGVIIWQLWRQIPALACAVGTILFLLAGWFLVWKHGFTRADGHVLGVFLYALPVGLVVLPLCSIQGQRPPPWLYLGAVPCLAGLYFFDSDLPGKLPGETMGRFQKNIIATWHFSTLPAAWSEELSRARSANALPAIRQRVGRSTVDVYNYEQGAALLNGLQFTPRPVFQSYSAYSPALARENLRYYQSPRSPDYLIWNHTSIDGRFPSQDDALLMAELPAAYRAVLSEGSFLLLEKIKPLPLTPLVRQLQHRQTARLGENVAVPTDVTDALWLQIKITPNLLGRLRALFYKPSELMLSVEETTGRQSVWRLLPRVAAEGFLLHPFLETQADFAAYLEGRASKQIHSLRITSPKGGSRYWQHAEITFYTLPGRPVKNEPPHSDFVAKKISPFSPAKVTASAAPEFFKIGSMNAVLLHAPSQVEFAVPAHTSNLAFGFGLRAGSYDAGGHSDGVDFSVTALWADGKTELLWQRTLDPASHPEDRGTQHATLSLPTNPPDSLVFSAHPGSVNNTDWDWAYWSGFQFTTSP